MTLKIKKSGPGTKKVPIEGFTHSENFLIDQLDAKKKAKGASKTEEDELKIGKMFKKKNKEAEEEEPEEDDMAPTVKRNKPNTKVQLVGEADGMVPGFSAPKAARKRVAEPHHQDAKKSKTAEGPEKRESKKALKVERKKKEGGSRFDLSVKAKKLWEELRREDTAKDRQLTLSAELYGVIKGKAKELVFAHDTARVIECLFEKASQEVREALFDELKSHTLNLAKSQYAHFYLMKVLRHGNKDHRNYIISALSGKVIHLMKHKIAAKVVETAYNDWANATQRAQLSQEFYGPEFKLFKDAGVTTLTAALEKYPEKKESFLKYMSEAIEPIIAKGVFNHSLLHRLTNEFLTHCSVTERAQMIQSLREAVIQQLHTRDGARVGMTCLWHGTAKDRKEILKSFKGNVTKICLEEHGHMVLLAAFDVMDDTKYVAKAIVSEIAINWREIVIHEHGRKVVMYLLAGRDPTYTHPQVVEILKHGDGNQHSKKEPAMRHNELLQYASAAWLDAVTAEPEMWLRDSRNCLVLAAILKFCEGDGLAAAFKAIASVVGHDLNPDTANMFSSAGDKVKYWVEQSAVHMVLKKLIQHDKVRKHPPYFSQILLSEVDSDTLKGWLGCNRGAFLLVNMLETEIDSVKIAVAESVKGLRKFLQKQNNKGADILDSKLSNFK